MGLKSAFKKLWMGIKVAAPYIGMAASFLPGGSILAVGLQTIEVLIENAEEIFQGDKTGPEKAAHVSREWLKALEILTGKNVDNPTTRALADRIITNVVKTKNLVAETQLLAEEYKDLAKDLQEAIDDAKATPAIPDDTPAPNPGPQP